MMAAESQEERVRLGLEDDPEEEMTSFLNSWATLYEEGVLDADATPHDGSDEDRMEGSFMSTDYEKKLLHSSDGMSELIQCPACENRFSFEALVGHLELCEAAKKSEAEKTKDQNVKQDPTPSKDSSKDEKGLHQYDARVVEIFLPPASFKGCSEATLVSGEWLYLGSSSSASSETFLKQANIGWILNCADDVEPQQTLLSKLGIQWKRLSVADTASSSLQPYFEEAFQFMDRAAKDKHQKNLLVHCSAGVSRSATLVTAYLMRSQNRSALDVLTQIRTKRPFVYPNKGFFRDLLQFEMAELVRTGKDKTISPSIPMEALSMHEDKAELTSKTL